LFKNFFVKVSEKGANLTLKYIFILITKLLPIFLHKNKYKNKTPTISTAEARTSSTVNKIARMVVQAKSATKARATLLDCCIFWRRLVQLISTGCLIAGWLLAADENSRRYCFWRYSTSLNTHPLVLVCIRRSRNFFGGPKKLPPLRPRILTPNSKLLGNGKMMLEFARLANLTHYFQFTTID
jgi:hypothetical protein